MKNCDLHTHSYYSDGAYSPTTLVMKAKEVGVATIALTDHNSVEGIPEAIEVGNKIGVNIIPGVELRAEYGEVLGYFIDIKNKELLDFCKETIKRQQERIYKIIEKLGKIGKVIDYNKLKRKAEGHVQRSHIAEELVAKGYAKTFRQAFDSYLIEGKPGHVEIEYFDTIKAIKTIKNAGGAAVLAHPWLENWKKEFEEIDILIEAGLDGIEISCGPNVKGDEEEEVKEKIKKLCKEKGLIITSGSDYHGPIHPNMIGEHNCDETVVEELKKKTKEEN